MFESVAIVLPVLVGLRSLQFSTTCNTHDPHTHIKSEEAKFTVSVVQ